MIKIIRRTKEQAEQSIARTNYMPTFPMSIIQLVVKILSKGDIDGRFVDHTGEDQGIGITTTAHVPANFPPPGIHFRM
jgi:hypothetical protein